MPEDLTLATTIWTDSQLPLATVSKTTDRDAIKWVNSSILPQIYSYVDSRIQVCSIPFGYPLDTTLLMSAFGNLNEESRQLIITGWESARSNSIYWLALSDLFLLTDSLNEEYTKKSKAFREKGEFYLNSLCSSLSDTINRIPDADTNENLGLLVFKTRKNKHYFNDGY